MRELTCSEVAEDALIERYLAGELPDDDVEALESHYLTCDRCYDELRLAVAVRDALPDVAKIDTRRLTLVEGSVGTAAPATAAGEGPMAPTRTRPGHRRWVGSTVAVAAAAVLAVLLFRPPRLEEPSTLHRSMPITAAPAPRADRPVGPVADARSFHWTAVSGADRYRVTLFNAEGAVLFETEQVGTEAVLPDSVLLAPGETYWWRINARVGFDRWAASDLIEFSITPGPRR